MLSVGYCFQFASFIYHLLSRVDKEFSDVVHNLGFGKELFKYFVFSNFFFDKKEIMKEGIYLPPDTWAIVYFSTIVPKIQENIVENGSQLMGSFRIDNVQMYLML